MSRVTPSRQAVVFLAGLAASTTVEVGKIVARNAAGYLVPGAAATTLKKPGVARSTVANSGSAGAVTCEYEIGCFRFANSADADLITIADIGNSCYIVDAVTVAKTNGSSTRSVAGEIVDVDASGVWVNFK